MTDTAEGVEPTSALREALAAAGCGRLARVGTTWAARASDGAPCTVQVISGGALRDELDDRVRALRGVDHPHVARIETVVEAEGRVAVVLRGARGPTLAEALARRDRLGAREAVALAVALAQALVALHRAGLVHGPLSPDDVVVDDQGRAHLRPCVRPAPRGAVRQDDVRALARLVVEALLDEGDDAGAGIAGGDVLGARALRETAQVRAALLGVITGGDALEAGTFAALAAGIVEAEPIRVPDLAELAAWALADEATRRAGSTSPATRAVPVVTGSTPSTERAPADRVVPGVVRRPVRPAPAPAATGRADGRPDERRADPLSRARRTASAERRARHRVRNRRRWTAAAGAVVLVAGVGAAVAAARGGADGRPAAVTSVGARTDPVLDRARPQDAARELTVRRERMLAGVAGADDVTVAGSSARAADDALVATIAARGRLQAVPDVEVSSARVVPDAAPVRGPQSQARVDVTYAVGATAITTSSGDTQPVASVASRTDRLDLTWTEAGWRVRAVE